MLIYTVMFYCYSDTELMLATADKDEALNLFESYSDFSLQVWENGEVLIDIWDSGGEYKSNGDIKRYSEKGQQFFREIVKQLQ